MMKYFFKGSISICGWVFHCLVMSISFSNYYNIRGSPEWYNAKSMIKGRYSRILWFFARIILSVIWWDLLLPRFGFRGLAQKTRVKRHSGIARAFRKEAVSLGGVMIKVGQFLSARLDVLPRVITDELAGLQDEVPPEPFENIRRVIETEFGAKLEDKFIDFSPVPLASASIGQVHLTRLRDKNEIDSQNGLVVAVKIQRLDISRIVKTDLAALEVVARWIMRYPGIKKRANVPALLSEFTETLYEELDYLHEGNNAEKFSQNFLERSAEVRVPEVIWSHTTKRVLTLEYLQAIKITDYDAIREAGIPLEDVASRLFDTYLQQIFDDQFFHADPHPGNLFVLPGKDDPQGWKLVFVDFGMAGVVPDFLLKGLREILVALATQDAKKIVGAYQNLGVLLPGANIDLLEKATARVFERFWGKTAPEMMKMHQTEAVAFVAEFGELVYEMPFQVPENMILLVRCLGILSGMCTGLDAGFNVWTSLMPYAQKLLETESGGKIEFLLKEVERFLRVILALPLKTDALLQRMEQGKLEVRHPELELQVNHLNRGIRKLTAAVVFAVFAWGSVQFILGSILVPGYILGGVALILLGWIIFG